MFHGPEPALQAFQVRFGIEELGLVCLEFLFPLPFGEPLGVLCDGVSVGAVQAVVAAIIAIAVTVAIARVTAVSTAGRVAPFQFGHVLSKGLWWLGRVLGDCGAYWGDRGVFWGDRANY